VAEFVERLVSNASFRDRAQPLGVVFTGEVRPLDGMLNDLRRFGTARRREVRVARLTTANRFGAAKWQTHRDGLAEAIRAFVAGVHALADLAQTLRPLINLGLDDVIALAADEDHPLSQALRETGKSAGLSDDEIEWLFEELSVIDYRPIRLVCADGFEDLIALLDGVSGGELGLLVAGFLRFTGDPETDRRIEKLVIRLRSAGVTASILLALVIVASAHFVATSGRSPAPA